MKLLTLFEEIELNELQGISFDSRVWNNVIRRYLNIGRNSPVITINGLDFPKEYKSFPVDQFNITVDPRFGNGAAYDENKSGYDMNKKYHVYFVMGHNIKDGSINHELRHAYEDFRRMSSGSQGMSKTKEAILFFSGDFEKLILEGRYFGPFRGLIEGLYYTSKIERSAYSDSVYDGRSVINDIVTIIRINDYTRINSRYNPDEMGKWWKELKESYKIPILEKYNNYDDFIKWATDEIKYKGEKTLKKLRNVEYLSKQKGAN